MIPWRDVLDKLDVNPKVSVIITVICFVFVMANNHFYFDSLQQREKDLRAYEARLQLREDALANRERVMRLWELEIVEREQLLRRLRIAPLDAKRD